MWNLPVLNHRIPHPCQPTTNKLRPVWENARAGKLEINGYPLFHMPPHQVQLGTTANFSLSANGIGERESVAVPSCTPQHSGLRVDVEVVFVRLKPCWSRTSPSRSLTTIIPGGFLPFPDGCGRPAWCCCSARSLPRRWFPSRGMRHPPMTRLRFCRPAIPICAGMITGWVPTIRPWQSNWRRCPCCGAPTGRPRLTFRTGRSQPGRRPTTNHPSAAPGP